MDSVMIPEEAWIALSKKVHEGDVSAIKSWIEHRYGKPKETIEQSTEIVLPKISWSGE